MGAAAGMTAGLLGIGGGIIIVPVLAMVFQGQGVDISVLMHTAIGTSLATIVITSLSSTRAHHKHGAIYWDVFKIITPGIIVGGLLGSVIASAIEGDLLRNIFIGFMFVVAFQFARGFATKPHRKLPASAGMFASGTVIGTISSMMGIGGGSMSVPFLTWCNMPVRNAVATSAAIGIPIAVASTIGFLVNGWSVPLRPAWSVGYVNLPAFFGIVVASTLFAPLGARLAHKIPERMLKRLFAAFLVIVAMRMLITG